MPATTTRPTRWSVPSSASRSGKRPSGCGRADRGNPPARLVVALHVTRAFEITYDYRCPFARNAHEHVLDALEAGADWEVTFVPFSLGQVHVAEGQPDVWDDPEADTGLLALQAGTVVRDKFPDRFLAVHRALFALRHDEGLQL